jgi:hypothetical protein
MELPPNRGLIKISDIVYSEHWKDLYVFMRDFRPTHIEFRFWDNNMWYMWGVSDKFDALKEGDQIPAYTVEFTRQADGSFTYEFVR